MKRILFALFCIIAVAADATEKTQEYFDPDVQKLLGAEYFVFGGFGVSGQIGDGEVSFGAIVQKKEAIRIIMAVFDHGNEQAKCYALVALRESSDTLFRSSLVSMRKNPPSKIRMAEGCTVLEVKPEVVFKAIEDGHYAQMFRHYEEKG